MDFKSLKLFSALQGKMSWLEKRQKLLAENIANSNTPNYKSRDLKTQRFSSYLSAPGVAKAAAGGQTTGGQAAMSAGKVAITHSGHMAPPASQAAYRVDSYQTQAPEVDQSGNGVGLEREMVKLAETQMDHSLVANLYSKHSGMLRVALGRGR